jgi:hypothetical protein
MLFSQRNGYKPVKKVFQLESMDNDLRTGIWNLFEIHIWNNVKYASNECRQIISQRENNKLYFLCRALWSDLFKKKLNTLSRLWESVKFEIEDYFFKYKWFEVYDFLEFVVNNYKFESGYDTISKESFIKHCNSLFEKENSAYRFIGGIIVRNTSEIEIEAIEKALGSEKNSVRTHLHCALEFLSDKKSPNYRNSIKEAISAVESMLTSISNSKKFSENLNKLQEKIELHEALKKAIGSLYGYASDNDGIRHAIMDKENNDFSDAMFMLVTCSAFINFVEGKLSKQ